MGLYIVRFLLNGEQKLQTINAEIDLVGEPLRFKPTIDLAIETWLKDNEIDGKVSTITNIRVYNSKQKLLVKQESFLDIETIKLPKLVTI